MTYKNLVCGALSLLIVATLVPIVEAQGPLRDRLRARWNARANARISPIYEPDRLLDITEWFDGNSYNPTNEVVDRLSDRMERQSRSLGQTTVDFRNRDNWFGFESNANRESNWFYDYYDLGLYSDATSDAYVSYRYYDTDNNGVYDTYTGYVDRDKDGSFDDETWYTFDYDSLNEADVKDEQSHATHATADDEPQLTGRQSFTGTVQRIKRTQTPQSAHMVVEIKPDSSESVENLYVDIGPASQADEWKIEKGVVISATGPVVKMGDKKLMLADKVELENESFEVQQQINEWHGVVVETKEVQVRDQNVLMAIVYTPQKERVLIDLGPVDHMKMKFEKETDIVIRGVPMEMKDRQVIVAHAVEVDGRSTKIYRASIESR